MAQYKEVSKQLESNAKQQRDPDAGSRQNEQQVGENKAAEKPQEPVLN